MSHIQEAVAQWANVYGSEHPDQAWILSDYDSWERNPHYTGPEQRHPEDYDYEDNMTDVQADADTLRSAGMGTDEDYGCFNDFDDIPF
jgi:hypothetical protein